MISFESLVVFKEEVDPSTRVQDDPCRLLTLSSLLEFKEEVDHSTFVKVDPYVVVCSPEVDSSVSVQDPPDFPGFGSDPELSDDFNFGPDYFLDSDLQDDEYLGTVYDLHDFN